VQEIKLSVNLVNGILNYLGSRPYAEVANLIAAVQQEAEKQASQNQPETPKEE
jgi:hypothetical protein